MKWSEQVQVIVNGLAAKYPALTNRSDDEARRTLTGRIAQTCRSRISSNYGHKRADPTRPLSADTFAYKENPDPEVREGLFVGWDWSTVPTADNPQGIAQFPESTDLAHSNIGFQTFVPVEPHDWLGTPAEPPPIVVPPTSDLVLLLNRLTKDMSDLKGTQAGIELHLQGIESLLTGIREGQIRIIQVLHDTFIELERMTPPEYFEAEFRLNPFGVNRFAIMTPEERKRRANKPNG